jgi:hypothetical protein
VCEFCSYKDDTVIADGSSYKGFKVAFAKMQECLRTIRLANNLDEARDPLGPGPAWEFKDETGDTLTIVEPVPLGSETLFSIEIDIQGAGLGVLYMSEEKMASIGRLCRRLTKPW